MKNLTVMIEDKTQYVFKFIPKSWGRLKNRPMEIRIIEKVELDGKMKEMKPVSRFKGVSRRNKMEDPTFPVEDITPANFDSGHFLIIKGCNKDKPIKYISASY